jgi:hypothetical protein
MFELTLKPAETEYCPNCGRPDVVWRAEGQPMWEIAPVERIHTCGK